MRNALILSSILTCFGVHFSAFANPSLATAAAAISEIQQGLQSGQFDTLSKQQQENVVQALHMARLHLESKNVIVRNKWACSSVSHNVVALKNLKTDRELGSRYPAMKSCVVAMPKNHDRYACLGTGRGANFAVFDLDAEKIVSEDYPFWVTCRENLAKYEN